MIEWLFIWMKNLLLDLSGYPASVSFFSGLFAGEIAILTLSFLSAQGFFPLGTLFLFAWIGEIVADLIYFEIGRFKIFGKVKTSKLFGRVDSFISSVSRESVFLAVLYSKFVYGLRTATVIFLGIKNVDRKNFILSEIIVSGIVMAILVPIGWAAGKGFTILMDHFKNIQFSITLLIILVVVFFLVRNKINEFVIKRKNNLRRWVRKEKL